MTALHSLGLLIPGPVRGKERPRFNRQTGRTYTAQQTRSDEGRVRDAWQAAGSIDLGDGPLTVTITLVVERPVGHWRIHGGLSAAGLRSWRPCRTPDADNAAKGILDSLNGCAYKDDAQVVDLHVSRVWATAGEREHRRVWIEQVPPTAEAVMALVALEDRRARKNALDNGEDVAA